MPAGDAVAVTVGRAVRMPGPIFFGVVFWGERFRRVFLEYCLASLLAPGNIPAIAGAVESRFLVCTTSEDWRALQDHPSFRRLTDLLSPEWLPMEAPTQTTARKSGMDGKMRAMSDGHRRLAHRMHEARAVGAFIYPDTVFADGTCAAAGRWIEEGKDAVLAFCPRLANDTILDGLAAYRRSGAEASLAIAPRALVELSLAHMHAEMRSCEWSSPAFSDEPTACWWTVESGKSLLCHGVIWYPLFINYGHIAAHNDSTFSAWTIDGDYVYRNIADPRRLQVVDDSDALMLTSFSPSVPAAAPQLVKRLPLLGPLFKSLILRNYLNSSRIDPLKRALFVRPIRLHAAEIAPAWSACEREAVRVVAAAGTPLGRFERRLLILLRILNEGVRLHFGFWVLKRLNRLSPGVRQNCMRTLARLRLVPKHLASAAGQEEVGAC
jgi:hypothetical protein